MKRSSSTRITTPDLNIRDITLLADDKNDYADSPAPLNRRLFAQDGWMRIARIEHDKQQVEIFACHAIEYHNRLLFPVYIKGPNRGFHQPFYRSTGKATPDRSPVGTMWPISGLYTEAYCKKSGTKGKPGYIGKHLFNPGTGNWTSHGKDANAIPPFYKEVAQAVAAAVTVTFDRAGSHGAVKCLRLNGPEEEGKSLLGHGVLKAPLVSAPTTQSPALPGVGYE